MKTKMDDLVWVRIWLLLCSKQQYRSFPSFRA